MKGNRFAHLALVATLGLAIFAPIEPVGAAMFDFMNPNRWFDNDYDRYRDRYYGGPYRWGGPYGWGGGPYGHGYGYGPYGYGGGPWGGYGGYPGYGPGNTIVVTPQSGSGDKQPPPRLPE